jgi:hypothetical protein
MSKRASLAEIMGKRGSEIAERGIRLADLPELLGEGMPELPQNAVGRFRLLRSLKARFGPNFRSLPGVAGVVKEFDENLEYEKKLEKIRGIKLEDFRKK